MSIDFIKGSSAEFESWLKVNSLNFLLFYVCAILTPTKIALIQDIEPERLMGIAKPLV